LRSDSGGIASRDYPAAGAVAETITAVAISATFLDLHIELSMRA
jgi:hypothetical protein